MAFTQITVTGSFQTPAGAPAVGTVSFTPVAAMRNAVGGPETTVATTVVGTLVDGELSVSLAATDDPGTTPTGVTYAVRTYILGRTEQWFIEVPHDGGPIDLGSAPVAVPVTPAMASFTPIVMLTQAEYDDLAPDPATLYIVTG
jgi:hypothetical protein